MLHDISRRPDRSSPHPNSHDQVMEGAVMSKGTNSVNYASQASTLGQLRAGLNGQMTIVKTLTPHLTQVTTTPSGAGAVRTDLINLATIAHGLPYIPAVQSFYGSSVILFSPLPSANYFTGTPSAPFWYDLRVTVDATNVYIDLQLIQFNTTATVQLPPLAALNMKIYLMQQTAN